jgi:hypothetical protein
MLCLSYYAYVFSSTKSVIRAERDLPETEEGAGWRNDSNNVCTCKLRNKNK